MDQRHGPSESRRVAISLRYWLATLCFACSGIVFAISLPEWPLMMLRAVALPDTIVTNDGLEFDSGLSVSGWVVGNSRRKDFSAAYNTLHYDPRRHDVAPLGQIDSKSCLFLDDCQVRENRLSEYLTAVQLRTSSFDNRFWYPRNHPATWQQLVNPIINAGPATLKSNWTADMPSGPILGNAEKSREAQGARSAATETYQGDRRGSEHRAAQRFARAAIFSAFPLIGSKSWSNSSMASVAPRTKILDLRWAANSQGQFLPVDATDEANANPKTLAATLTYPASALASSIASTERIVGTHVYKAVSYPSDGSGELTAHALDAFGQPQSEPEWTANIPPANARNILTWNGTAGSPFVWEGLSTSQQLAFDNAVQGVNNSVIDDVAKAQEVLAWLRGDQSREAPQGPYRRRERLLGDILNSDLLYVGDESFPKLALLAGEGSTYRDFVASKKARPKMVYVGANDGMVHGFIAGAGTGGQLCGASALGREVFAYVPGVLVGALPHLAKPDYAPLHYANGPLFAGDAYLNLDGQDRWRTILLGALGNGGRAVFALDVTDPCAIDASKVLWEFANDPDLGYTHARPLTAKLNNGQWAAIVANGYNSAKGHAVLFLLDLKTGAIIKKIDADAGAGRLDNGLLTPTLHDANGDGIVDYVYAGDNLGRLWKFDLSSASPADWKVAFGGQPLFDTGGEPIYAAPRLGDAPPGSNGVMVYVGSGRLISEEDKTDRSSRALYGILDKGVGNLSRANLRPQTVIAEVTVSGRSIRKSTRATVDYTTQYGWYLPLSAGERVIAPAQFVSRRILFVSINPSSDAAGGVSWVYELEPLTGAMPAASIFVLGLTPLELAALKLQGFSKTAIFLRDYGVGQGVMLSQDRTGKTHKEDFLLTGLRPGRVSWREIID